MGSCAVEGLLDVRDLSTGLKTTHNEYTIDVQKDTSQ